MKNDEYKEITELDIIKNNLKTFKLNFLEEFKIIDNYGKTHSEIFRFSENGLEVKKNNSDIFQLNDNIHLESALYCGICKIIKL